MKKFFILPLLVLSMFFTACTTTTESTTETAAVDPTAGPTDESLAEPVKIIDHQYRGLKEVPEWVTMAQGKLEQMEDFEDFVIFKEMASGKDLNAVKVWATEFNVGSQIAKLVSDRVQTKFAGAMVGDVDQAETYFEKIVKSMSEAKVGGAKRYDEYWILRQYNNDDGTTKKVYEYYILITVPVDEVKKAIARAFDENPPQSEEEIRARDHVREAMDDDLW